MWALSPAWAGDLRGRLQLTDLGAFERDDSLADALGAQHRNEVRGDLRLIWEPRWAGWALLATGMTLEWTPLLFLEPTLIVNLNDGSWELTTLVDWSLTENRSLIVGIQAPVGPRGSEYGGLPLSGDTAPYVAPSRFVYLQLRQYF